MHAACHITQSLRASSGRVFALHLTASLSLLSAHPFGNLHRASMQPLEIPQILLQYPVHAMTEHKGNSFKQHSLENSRTVSLLLRGQVGDQQLCWVAVLSTRPRQRKHRGWPALPPFPSQSHPTLHQSPAWYRHMHIQQVVARRPSMWQSLARYFCKS